jgi:hypothetical protein
VRPGRLSISLFLAAALAIAATRVSDDPSAAAVPAGGEPEVELFEWERGIGVRSLAEPSVEMYLWFYEWNLFGAMEAGQQTEGTYSLPRAVSAAGRSASIESPALSLEMTAAGDAVDLVLTVVNRTDRGWPPLATIVPCFNPGFNPNAPPNCHFQLAK